MGTKLDTVISRTGKVGSTNKVVMVRKVVLTTMSTGRRGMNVAERTATIMVRRDTTAIKDNAMIIGSGKLTATKTRDLTTVTLRSLTGEMIMATGATMVTGNRTTSGIMIHTKTGRGTKARVVTAPILDADHKINGMMTSITPRTRVIKVATKAVPAIPATTKIDFFNFL